MLLLVAKIIVGIIVGYLAIALAMWGTITAFPGIRDALARYMLSGKIEEL